MKNTAKIKNVRRRRGQGMTEYIIIVGLIAVGLITAVQAFGGSLSNAFTKAQTSIDKNVTAKIPN